MASSAHLAMMSPGGAFRAVVASSQRMSKGVMTAALAATVTRRPPVLLLRKVTAMSAGRGGRLCSPGPVTTYAVSSSHTCHAGQARSPGMSIHSSPDFLPASDRSALGSVTRGLDDERGRRWVASHHDSCAFDALTSAALSALQPRRARFQHQDDR